MRRKEAAPVFKPYVMNQISLIPPSYDELIAEKHLVRTVNEAVEKIDLTALLLQYKGGRNKQLPPENDAKGAGICLLREDLFLTANSQSTEREYPLHVDQRRKHAGFQDDQCISQQPYETSDR
jgi:hypothetical protein